jgi:DNA (cytosine-5)-methyltransferase 1
MPRLRVATDCSGIEAPIQAFRMLNIPIRHMWSSDIDKYARQSIEANYDPETIFDDVSTRDHSVLPSVDWYIAGFPCQSFSIRGNQHGFNDQRGELFFQMLDTISSCTPSVFILENVKGILSNDSGKTLKRIMKELNGLGTYRIELFLLNSLDFGSPQSRERVFFVGIRNDKWKREIKLPEQIPLEEDLFDLIEEDVDPSYYRNVREFKTKYGITTPHPFSFDLCNPRSGPKEDLETTHCILTTSRIYVSPLKRFLTPREHLRLQGFPEDFNIVVSDNQAYKQAGNSMNVHVLCALYQTIREALA